MKDRRSRKSKRSRSRSKSPRRSKKSKHRSKGKDKSAEPSPHDVGSRQSGKAETEEEYDARLEREEKERIEARKKSDLERIKRRYQDDSADGDENGVRFKGIHSTSVVVSGNDTNVVVRSWTHEIHRSRVT